MSAWILTHRGCDHFLSGPEALSNPVDIEDVAWSLAQINRFTGHASRPYSVAEHSLLCADLARDAGCGLLPQLACLTHDGHESSTGDLSGPGKVVVGAAWNQFENLQAKRFRQAMHLSVAFAAHHRVVKFYDLVALATERRDLMAYRPGRNLPWPVIDAEGAEIPPADGVDLNEPDRIARAWHEWRDLFLARYFELRQQLQQQALAHVAA